MLNNVVLMGRLCSDPELRHTPNDVAVTTFRLAVDRRYQKQGEERQADFITVVAWRGTAEFVCKYFTKGQMLAVTGMIQTRNFEDRDGNKRTAVEVVAETASFCGSKAEGRPQDDGQAPQGYSNGSDEDFDPLDDGDLPF